MAEMNLKLVDIQLRLTALGFDPGPCDGIRGPRTIAAIKRAQRWHGLKADGIVGPNTTAALWPDEMPERDEDVASPDVSFPATRWPRQKDAQTFYGKPGENQVTLELPFAMCLAWDKRKKLTRFSIHQKVHDSAAEAFAEIARAYSEIERKALGLDLFGGCLNVRVMRGGSKLSMHSYGIAIDFDPVRNQLKWGRDKARLAHDDAEPFWRAWEKQGWVSLGRTRNFDWMHVQAARL